MPRSPRTWARCCGRRASGTARSEVWQSQLEGDARQRGAARHDAPLLACAPAPARADEVRPRAGVAPLVGAGPGPRRAAARSRSPRWRSRPVPASRRRGAGAGGRRWPTPASRSTAGSRRGAAPTRSPRGLRVAPRSAARRARPSPRRSGRRSPSSTATRPPDGRAAARRRPRRRGFADWAALTERALGFALPVHALVRVDARRARTAAARSASSPTRDGRVVVLRQDGWEIVYGYADDAPRAARRACGCVDAETEVRDRRSIAGTDAVAPFATRRRIAAQSRDALAHRAGAGEAQPVPARHRPPRRRLPHARVAVRRARLRRHAHARAARRRRDRARAATCPGVPADDDLARARRARAAARRPGRALASTSTSSSGSRWAADWAAAVPTRRRCCWR